MGKTHKKRDYFSARKTERKLSKAERKKVRERINQNDFEDLPDYKADGRNKDELK